MVDEQAAYDPFDPTTYVKGGLRGVLECVGTVTGVYYGDGMETYKYPNIVYVLELGDTEVLKHEDETQVGPLGDYSVLYPFGKEGKKLQPGSVPEIVIKTFEGLGLVMTVDGSGLIGKRLRFQEKLLKTTFFAKENKTVETKRLVPVEIVGAAKAQAAKAKTPTKAGAKTPVATGAAPAVGAIPAELAALAAESEDAASFKQQALLKHGKAVRATGLFKAVIDGSLYEKLLTQGQ